MIEVRTKVENDGNTQHKKLLVWLDKEMFIEYYDAEEKESLIKHQTAFDLFGKDQISFFGLWREVVNSPWENVMEYILTTYYRVEGEYYEIKPNK